MKETEEDKATVNGTVLRLSANQRIQHATLMLSLILLAATGFALKYNDTAAGQWLIRMEGGMASRGFIHRASAVVLIALSVYHALYSFISEWGFSELNALKPRRSDAADFLRQYKFNAGTAAVPPKFAKYSYVEKTQYWGVIAGILAMTITGLAVLFKNGAMIFLPKWMIDVIFVVHGWQGTMLFVMLMLWHLYNVHLAPGRFPMSRTWLDGRMSLEELKRTHELEYERLKESSK
jgi:formate dehydrogenase subunit gamma